MHAKVAVVGTLKFPPEQVAGMLPPIKTLIEASRLHHGCVAYDVAVDCFEPGVIRVSELWSDQQCLQRHIDTPDVPAWNAALRECGVLESQYIIFDVSAARVV